jgi:hypothetical protein
MPASPPPLLPRDLAIVRLVARSRAVPHAVLSKLFFDGNDPGRVLGVLAKEQEMPRRSALVKVHSRALKGNVSYTTITSAGLAAAGVVGKKRSAESLGPAALDKVIAICVFCCLGAERRHRLDRNNLTESFGSGAPPDNVFHVASRELGWPAIFRAVFATSVDQRQLERIKRHVEEAKRNDAIRSWLDAGDYGFAILVPQAAKVQAMLDLIAKSSLAKNYVVIVDVGPTAETLHHVVKG